MLADLNSVLGWGFPSWTGGVMSYIDTMGWRAFIALCDALAESCGDQFRIDDEIRQSAAGIDRIYPPED